MLGLIIGAIAGVFIIVVLPSMLPERYKGVVSNSAIWLLGVLVILFALASTSFVYVPDGYSAHRFRIYLGRALPPGKIVAASGENGPQAEGEAAGSTPARVTAERGQPRRAANPARLRLAALSRKGRGQEVGRAAALLSFLPSPLTGEGGEV